STAVGQGVAKLAADDIKSVTLELGGKSPAIILEDANLEEAIEGAFDGTMYNMGQNCSACTRVYVQRSIYEKVVDGIAEHVAAVKLGAGLDSEANMGPLVSEKQQHTVLGYIEKGKEEGARIVVGGGKGIEKGYFVEPTVFADVKDDMTIAREEICGPVMSIFPFEIGRAHV